MVCDPHHEQARGKRLNMPKLNDNRLKGKWVSTFKKVPINAFKAVISVYGHTFILYGYSQEHLTPWFDSIMEVLGGL